MIKTPFEEKHKHTQDIRQIQELSWTSQTCRTCLGNLGTQMRDQHGCHRRNGSENQPASRRRLVWKELARLRCQRRHQDQASPSFTLLGAGQIRHPSR